MLGLGAHYLWCHIREAVTNSHLHGDIHVIYAQVSFPNLLNYDEFVYQVLFFIENSELYRIYWQPTSF